MSNLKIVYFGHNGRGINCLNLLNLIADKYNFKIIRAIGLNNDKNSEWFKSIEMTALSFDIEYDTINNPNEKNFIDEIKSYKPDLGIMCGYSKYISNELRKQFKIGIINLHASDLPNYRGGSPLNWAIINGEKEIGISMYWLNDGIDTGPMIFQDTFEITQNTDIKEVLFKVNILYQKLLTKFFDLTPMRTPSICHTQSLNSGSYYTTRKPEDSKINWGTMTDVEIHNLVRALTKPYSGAFFYFPAPYNKKIIIWKTKLESRNFYGSVGRIASIKDGVIIIAANRGIKVISAEIKNKNFTSDTNLKNIFNIGGNCI